MVKVKHIYEEYPKHDWELDKDGNIDLWAWESGYHAGPMCKRCAATPCCYCETEEEWNKGPCIEDKWICPQCGKRLYTMDKYNYCPMCGEQLDWSDYDANH